MAVTAFVDGAVGVRSNTGTVESACLVSRSTSRPEAPDFQVGDDQEIAAGADF